MVEKSFAASSSTAGVVPLMICEGRGEDNDIPIGPRLLRTDIEQKKQSALRGLERRR